jgi:hypothetical protein
LTLLLHQPNECFTNELKFSTDLFCSIKNVINNSSRAQLSRRNQNDPERYHRNAKQSS